MSSPEHGKLVTLTQTSGMLRVKVPIEVQLTLRTAIGEGPTGDHVNRC